MTTKVTNDACPGVTVHWPAIASSGPLAGVKVIEVASFISGPFATMMLADLGADVLKVEPPRGDPFRRFGRPSTSISPVFANTNHNKRSVTLDLKAPDGREALLRLAREADVLVCNWRPAVAERLQFEDDVFERANPQLVRAYVSGFGAEGPYADQPVFDSIIQARSGMTYTQALGDTPEVAPTYLADKLAASIACQAVLAALVARQATGTGTRVEVAMLDAAAYLNYPDAFANRTFVDHQPVDARNRQAAAVRPLQAIDGWLVVVPVTADQVRRACAAVGHDEWADELLGLGDAEQMTTEFARRMESVTMTAPVERWLAAFGEFDVPAAPCLGIDEHLADAQVVHNGIYSVSDWPGLGRVRQVRYPAAFAGAAPLPAAPAPAVGAHNDDFIAAPRDGEGAVLRVRT